MGSGYREFQASEVLTSSNVQNYLMDQSVMSFAGTAARASAIAAPEVGMVSYIGSSAATEGIEVYNAAGYWDKSWNMPWGLLAFFSTTSSYSTSSGTASEINTAFRLSIPGIANRQLRFTFSSNYGNTGGGGLVEVRNVTASTTVGRVFQSNETLSDGLQGTGSVVGNSPSVTSTYTLRWQRTVAGTFVINGILSQFMIEDIGPAGAPV